MNQKVSENTNSHTDATRIGEWVCVSRRLNRLMNLSPDVNFSAVSLVTIEDNVTTTHENDFKWAAGFQDELIKSS